jgi:hypothetical protein
MTVRTTAIVDYILRKDEARLTRQEVGKFSAMVNGARHTRRGTFAAMKSGWVVIH